MPNAYLNTRDMRRMREDVALRSQPCVAQSNNGNPA